MRNKILFVLLTLASFAASAINLTWVAPTQREDGTALTAAEIASYTINVWLNGVAQPDLSVPGTAVSYTYVDTVKGKYCFALETVDTMGLVSVPTGQVCRNANPKPPSALAVK